MQQPSPSRSPASSASLAWQKSSHSQGGQEDCVQVARAPHPATGTQAVFFRDSKNPEGPQLTATPAEFRELVARIKIGTFDVA
jgi:hypothetical protein